MESPPPPPPPPQASTSRTQEPDIRMLYDAFQDLVRASAPKGEPRYIPPQIPVTCRGETRMFGRRTLAGMSYSKAIRMFRKRFQQEGDITHLPGKYEPEMLFDHYPRVGLVATFIGATTRAQKAGVIDESSWTELLKNVESIEVFITPVTETT
ncbi:hypothetical protein PLEOSDRAFT_1104110 [Pleurotus ostreatus PC15]|uniref:Uncharacterized protein n=1 Tax=Pleurotus ostreatus (strain PC15) TaxID=1137138 RepID=A0A067NHV0_PLEO1|nr:hypothetical protein PLEOSDRAFT_1104110 [Pleurotus ostreatus PC15]